MHNLLGLIMQIDLEHVHYWIQAIRNSDSPTRTMDAFWRGQIQSKEWLCNELKQQVQVRSISIDIYGGWVGVLASMLFQSKISVSKIRSIDIDPSCKPVAETMNKIEEMMGKFEAITADMCDFPSQADVIINTSFEHINQSQYEKWVENLKNDSLLVLQTNDYNIPEHVRCANTLDEFKAQACLNEILYEGELNLPLYKRFMIIGKK
jgi:uncharacterized protein (UPF0147 family)